MTDNRWHLYEGNKMVGVSEYNVSWFDQTEVWLLASRLIAFVFNPATRDRQAGIQLEGTDGKGTSAVVRRECLKADWQWIAQCSQGMVVGPQWRDSPGTISEVACHQALFLPCWEETTLRKYGIAGVLGAAMINGQNAFTIPLLIGPAGPGSQFEDDGLVCDCL